MIQFSLITKDEGILTKRYKLGKKGELLKESSQCFLDQGTIESVSIDFSELPDFLDNLNHNQAITHGLSVDQVVNNDMEPMKIVSRRLLGKFENATTRTKDKFFWPEEGIIMFDYDPPDDVTPKNKNELIKAVKALHPELEKAAMVWRPSASSNIVGEDGTVYAGLKNQRIYVKYKNPEYMDRFIDNLFMAAWEQDLGYIFITAAGTTLPRTLFDKAVFSPERLDFAAGGFCEEGLKNQIIKSVYYSGESVDFENIGKTYDEKRFNLRVEHATRNLSAAIIEKKDAYQKAQIEKLQARGLTRAKAKKTVAARMDYSLLPTDVIYRDDMTPVEISDILDTPEAYAGQTFRDPLEPEYGKTKAKLFIAEDGILINSFAHGGRVFRIKFDVNYYLEMLQLQESSEDIEVAWLEQLKNLEATNAEKEKVIKEVSNLTGISLTALRADLKEAEKRQQEEKDGNQNLTHAQMAENLRNMLPIHSVATEGSIYIYEEPRWASYDMEYVRTRVKQEFDGQALCKTKTNYDAVTNEVYMLMEDKEYFHTVNPVVATNDGCWLLCPKQATVKRVEHDPKYRVRSILPFDTVPKETEMPLFTRFLDWAFEKDPLQIDLCQEIFGAVVFGVLTRMFHKAVLLRGTGGNGKSTLLDILSGMIPKEFISHVSPFQFKDEKYRAELANKMLNICPELEKSQRLPSASFKQIVDSSTLSARFIYGSPFEFPSTAAHIFSSNHILHIRDESAGMKRRWIMLMFENTISDSDKVHGLANTILETESPQIFNWALDGAARLCKNNKFTETRSHRKLLGDTFAEADIVHTFVKDDDAIKLLVDEPRGVTMERKKSYRVLRSGLWAKYRDWHEESGYPKEDKLTKKQFNDKMIELGFEEKKTQGKVYWMGLRLAT